MNTNIMRNLRNANWSLEAYWSMFYDTFLDYFNINFPGQNTTKKFPHPQTEEIFSCKNQPDMYFIHTLTTSNVYVNKYEVAE